MNGLVNSRKFWLMVWGLVQTVAGHYLKIPADILFALDGLVAVLIASIAHEDAADKRADKMTVPPAEAATENLIAALEGERV